ncbi:hypothetical protein CLAIMM_11675 [Cladophialophora immunda]|nr:hypothetical protein CLAIMM_11675 [Cladophialophora immunda]
MAREMKAQLESKQDGRVDSKHEELATVENIATNEIDAYLPENVSYGELGIRALFSSPFVSGAAFLASLGGFSFGYDQGVISIINTMDQFHKVFPRTESAFGKSFMTAMLQMGCFVACWFFPWLADTISRKWALTVVVAIFTIGAVIQTAAESYGTLVSGRTITGLGVGTLALGSDRIPGILAEVQFQRILQERHHPGVTGFKLEIYSWLDLFSRKVFRRTIVGIGIAFFQQFSGINAFIYYAPTLFESIGQTPHMALVLSGIFNVLQLVAVAACFLIIDNVGRRPLAIFGGFGTAACSTVIAALSGVYEDDWSRHTAAGWACVTMAFLFILIFGLTFSPLGWALPPEVFPTSCRSKGVALAVATNWLANFIIGVSVPPMIDSMRFGTYVFFAFFCFASGVFSYLLIPETKGKTLEEMDAAFGDTSGAEERELMKNAIISARRTSAMPLRAA